jgi:hypothetical protein
VTEKKKEKKATKKGTKKEKKPKEVEHKEEEKVDGAAESDSKENKPKYVAPVHNRPLRPSERGVDLTPEMKKYVNFAMKGNKSIHMYDPHLRQLQERGTKTSTSGI